MAIITISRQIGSLGDEIARETADRLGYDYIEKVQISEILSKLGFSLSDIDKYDEKKPSVWQSLTAQKERFAHFIRAAMYEVAARRNVVIVGRGGQAILKDIPGTLHVRIVAPFGLRVSRLMEQRGYQEDDAQHAVRQGDRDSSGYLNTYFDANPNNIDLYDLIINTRTTTLNKSTEIITCAVDGDDIAVSPPMSETLNDLALKHKVKAVILEVTGGGELVSADVQKRVVSLSGIVESQAVKNACEKAVSKIPGIESVSNQIGVQSKDGRIF